MSAFSPSDGLKGIDSFRIPSSLLHDTISFLREVGRNGEEGFVLWGGKRKDNELRFTSVVIPDQQALKTPDGLLVLVPGEALFTVNKQLHEAGEILGAQVHTHPTSAYHSSTDDHYPLVTLLGALSLVIPDFAKHAPADMNEWAWYRLIGCGEWAPLTSATKVTIE